MAFENDGVAGQDNNYSNGIGVRWTSVDASRYPDDSLTGTLLWLGSFLPQMDDPDFVKVDSFALFQHIFTPQDISLADPPANDRPYSGGRFFDSSIYLRDQGVMHSYTLRLGVIGPSSVAEDVQGLVHKAIGSAEPAGWDTQLKDEPILNLSYNCLYHGGWVNLGRGVEFDLLPSFGIPPAHYPGVGIVTFGLWALP